jgi:hypothetical protein
MTFYIKFQDEKYRMMITQTALVREFLALSFKVNGKEWNYIGRLESYKVGRHQKNI